MEKNLLLDRSTVTIVFVVYSFSDIPVWARQYWVHRRSNRMQQLMGGRANNLARFFSFLLSLQKKAFHSCNGECPRSSLREGRIYEGYTARGKEWLQIVFVPGRTRDARENPTLAMPTTKERREPKVVIIVVAKKLRQSLNFVFTRNWGLMGRSLPFCTSSVCDGHVKIGYKMADISLHTKPSLLYDKSNERYFLGLSNEHHIHNG